MPAIAHNPLPIKEPEEDQDLSMWPVLLNVFKHGTDHRAQLLRLLNDMGIETLYLDYIFYNCLHPGERMVTALQQQDTQLLEQA
jgi:uncharacterized damage-inducible protein DinB